MKFIQLLKDKLRDTTPRGDHASAISLKIDGKWWTHDFKGSERQALIDVLEKGSPTA